MQYVIMAFTCKHQSLLGLVYTGNKIISKISVSSQGDKQSGKCVSLSKEPLQLQVEYCYLKCLGPEVLLFPHFLGFGCWQKLYRLSILNWKIPN